MKKDIILMILSGILTIFIWHNFFISGNNIIFLFIFLASIITMKQIFKDLNKRKIIVTSIVSVLFSSAEIICNSINLDYTLNHIINKWLVINFFGYYIIAMTIINIVFNAFYKFKNINCKYLDIKKIKNKNLNNILTNEKVIFITSIVLIFIAWIPYFLRYYPGIVTSDSYSQIEMGIGDLELSNHHPITHTGIIAIFINIGLQIFRNINTGIALYSLASMIIMAILGSLVLKYLRKKNVSKLIRLIVLLYYMFYPVNGMYSITMWKDIFFSGMIPILIIIYRELLLNTEMFLSKKKNIVFYIIVSLLVILLKHNGLYAIILSMPFVMIALKKYWRKTVPMFLTVIILYIFSNILIYDILNINKGSIAEMLSIPTQQIARVEKKYRNELNDTTLEKINNYFKVENIGDYYNPILSDPVKFKLNDKYFNENKIEFIQIWIELLFKYPKDYIESFISNSYGYYYIEATNWVVLRETMDNPNNIMGIEQQPIINSKLVDFVSSTIDQRNIPLLSMCFSIGVGFWLIIICLAYKIYLKEYKNILMYLPILILWLTMIASPVFCEFRYAYPIFTTLPLFISLNFLNEGESDNEKKDCDINTML